MLHHNHSKHGELVTDKTTDSLYTCTIRPKSFPVKQNLTRHMLTHKDPCYKCMCGKPFHRTDLLAKHQRRCQKTSAGAEVCDICGTPFTRKSNLTRHKKKCDFKQTTNNLIRLTKEYEEKLKRGQMLEKILKQHSDLKEEALDGSHKAYLKLYQASFDE